MITTILLALLAGSLLGNGLPHFLRGITNEAFPCRVGHGPVPNFLAGWVSLLIIGLIVPHLDLQHDGEAAFFAGCAGLLLFGYLHAAGILKRFS